MNLNFYTYLWLRENGTPYYVGKGVGKRAYFTYDHGVKCPKNKLWIIVQEHASEQDAFEAEQFLISYYGRKDMDSGCLRNLTNGGEGISGMRHSAETRKKLSRAHKGKVKSESHLRNISIALTGKKHSAITIAKLRVAASKRPEDWRIKLSAIKKGKPWSNARRAAQRKYE